MASVLAYWITVLAYLPEWTLLALSFLSASFLRAEIL